MAAAGSNIVIADYDTLQSQITALENTGVNAVMSAVAGNGTTTSTSFTSTLTGSTSPAVTVSLAAGQGVLIYIFAGSANNTAGDGVAISFAVSGGSTEAATDARGANWVLNSAASINNSVSLAKVILYTAGSATSYTFTMNQRAVTGGTATTANRTIIAVPLPYNS